MIVRVVSDLITTRTYYSEEVESDDIGFETCPVSEEDTENSTDGYLYERITAGKKENNSTAMINYSYETDEFEVNLQDISAEFGKEHEKQAIETTTSLDTDTTAENEDDVQSHAGIPDDETPFEAEKLSSISIQKKSSLRRRADFNNADIIGSKKVMFEDQIKLNNEGVESDADDAFKSFDSLLQSEAIEISKSRSFSKTLIDGDPKNKMSSGKHQDALRVDEKSSDKLYETSRERGGKFVLLLKQIR